MDNQKVCKRCQKLQNLSLFKSSKKTGKPLNPCLECVKKIKKIDRENNKNRDNITKARWAKKNQEKVKESRKKWKNQNIGKVKADKIRRKEYVKLATPKWLTPIQIEAIEFYYMVAELRTLMSGIKHEVDHIHPLRGKNFCGLNVPWNLEVITREENGKKSNKLLPHRIGG